VVGVPLHPDVEALACLLGTWRGTGQAVYPTTDDFGYTEELTYSHVGKPQLAWRQSTVLDDGRPAHAEVGYLRGLADRPGEVELVLAHPAGLIEAAVGEVEVQPDGLALHLRSTAVVGTPAAKEVLSVERRITVTGDVLRYQLAMAAVGQAHQHHLAAELHRA